MTLKSVRYLTTSIAVLRDCRDSKSQKSHVQFPNSTSDIKRSVVLSDILCITTLNYITNVKDTVVKRTNGRMSVNRLKQNILHVHEVNGLRK